MKVNDGWESLGTFIVEYQAQTETKNEQQQFRTLVTQMDVEKDDEADSNEWSGLEVEAPCGWIGMRLLGKLTSLFGVREEDE
ncbi:MAG: hypothetical protein L3K52_04460 [Candidatus Thiothrix sulfatifontis]|nr:MAG: hypothetical protein L3K52_04460 [Candidatus Thiothrix sulfatifontis]